MLFIPLLLLHEKTKKHLLSKESHQFLLLLFPNCIQGILVQPYLYLDLCRSMTRGLLSDVFQKCVSHTQWESWL